MSSTMPGEYMVDRRALKNMFILHWFRGLSRLGEVTNFNLGTYF